MRLFVAVNLGEAVHARVAELLALERATVKAKWVRAESLHLTMVFIGETKEQALPELIAATTRVAERHRPFKLSIEGAGTFGGKLPRVLWLGVGGQLIPLQALASELSAELGIVSEHGEYRPHLTLARSAALKGDGALAEVARRLDGKELGGWAVSHVTVYESAGGRYRALATVSLGSYSTAE